MYCIVQSQHKAPNLYFTTNRRWSENIVDVRLFDTEAGATREWERIRSDHKSGWNRANPLSVVRI